MENPTLSLLNAKRKPISYLDPIQAVPDLPTANEPAVSSQFLEQMQKQFTDDIVRKEFVDLPNILDSPTLQANSSSKGDYLDRLSKYESSGSYTANREGSQFYGAYQYNQPTAQPYLDKIGKTWNDFKLIPSIQDEVAGLATAHNVKLLQDKGIEPTMRNMYFIHQQGRKGGIDVIQGNPNDSIYGNMPSNLPKTKEAYMNYWTNKWN